MKKVSLLASAAAVSAVGLAGPVFAQAGGPFADVPTDHWAYASVDRLQKAGVVIGYPDGTYGGKRAMTRYEFAVAIARLLDKIPPAGVTDEQLKAATANLVSKQQLDEAIAGIRQQLAGFATREEVDNLRRLVTEFQNELTTLGVEVDTIRRRLDGLEGRVTVLENEFKRVRIGGSVNLMVRGNHRTGSGVGGILDYDGYRVTGGPGTRGSILTDTRVLHDLDLNVRARLSDTATAEAVINFGNYLPFLNSVSSFSGSRSDRFGEANPILNQRVNQDQDQTIYKLMVEAPIRLPGLGGVALSVGRIPVQFTPYTLRLIDVDSYFFNEKTDLGDIPVDGAKGTFKLGPVGITAFAAKVDPIKRVSDVGERITSGDFGGYGLYAGAAYSPFGTNAANAGFRAGRRPRQSLINPISNGAMPVENIAGARATFGAAAFGTIGLTYLAMGGPSQVNPTQTTPPGGAPGIGTPRDFDRVYVYGADINTNFGGLGLTGSYTVSNTATSRNETGGDANTVRDEDTYAWEAAGSYTLGALNLGAGYRHISPFFAAPGYWAKIGAWTNPVDIEGPFVRASYALGAGLTLAAEGHFYEGTGDARDQGGLAEDDEVTSFKAGLKYGLTSVSAVDLGVEYTQYDLTGIAARPREIFYNIGYGFSFNPNSSFKLLYQVVDYKDNGSGFDPLNRKGGVAAAQFSVKF